MDVIAIGVEFDKCYSYFIEQIENEACQCLLDRADDNISTIFGTHNQMVIEGVYRMRASL